MRVADFAGRDDRVYFPTAAEDGTDLNCMAGDEELASLKITVDGRDVFDTDGRSNAMRAYQNVLAGRPGFTAEPSFAQWYLGSSHKQYQASVIPGLIKNGTVNELDVDLQCEAGSGSTLCDVIAVHIRQFTFADGTIRATNAY